jgi:hypothetical protein
LILHLTARPEAKSRPKEAEPFLLFTSETCPISTVFLHKQFCTFCSFEAPKKKRKKMFDNIAEKIRHATGGKKKESPPQTTAEKGETNGDGDDSVCPDSGIKQNPVSEPPTSIRPTTAQPNENPSANANTDAWVCMHCLTPHHDAKAKVVECEICCQHACSGCLQLTPTQYTATQRPDLIWVCSAKCRETLRNALKPKEYEQPTQGPDVLGSIKLIQEKLATIENKMELDRRVMRELEEWPALSSANQAATN